MSNISVSNLRLLSSIHFVFNIKKTFYGYKIFKTIFLTQIKQFLYILLRRYFYKLLSEQCLHNSLCLFLFLLIFLKYIQQNLFSRSFREQILHLNIYIFIFLISHYNYMVLQL